MKYEVVFFGYLDEETAVNEKFESKSEAEDWAFGNEYSFNDIAMDSNGNDYWVTVYRYYNPEDEETYLGYSVNELKIK